MSRQAAFAVRQEIKWLCIGTVVAAACIWPWKALQTISAKQHAVDQQLMQVQMLAAQAQHLRSKAQPAAGDPGAQLQQAVHHHWGKDAQLMVTGDRAVLTLQSVAAAQWVTGLEALQQNVAVRVESAKLELIEGGRVSGRVELQWPSSSSVAR